MNSATDTFRRSLYALLATVAAGLTAGHIVATERSFEPSIYRTTGAAIGPAWPTERPTPTPTLRSNDRSRWATVRALVEEGTYVVGHRDPARASPANPYGDHGILFEDGWQTVDRVLRPDTQEFYSSKPPLLSTLVAGEAWVLKRVFGWSLVDDEQRFWIVRTILLFNNLVPLVFFWLLLGSLLERLGTTDWGRLFVFTAACFATYLTAFATTLNNHTIAAFCCLFALVPTLSIWNGAREAWRFATAGFFAGLMACVDLPSASLAALLFAVLLIKCPTRALLAFLPALALPVSGFFFTNYLAIGMWRPAYSEFGGAWYEYPGSHWLRGPTERRGIDWAFERESRLDYAFHFLFGHHGVFSLSPIWLIAVVGIAMAAVRRAEVGTDDSVPRAYLAWLDERRLIALLSLVVSVVVVGFYLYRSRNYGGGTAGPRWLIWLTPLWLLSMAPAADWLAVRRWGRGLALAALALSALSVAYPMGNPWRHPWLYNLLVTCGWPAY